MDKKNTMLLTVVAVATLLVAVVGATFAFFTATNEATGSTTVTATTETVGAVTINNPTTDMHIYLAAVNMAQQEGMMKPYYATTDDEKDFVETIEYQSISEITVKGGESGTSYHCSYNIAVNKDTDLEANDAAVTFRKDDVANVSNLTLSGATFGSKIDIVSAGTYKVEFDVTGNIENASSIVSAGFELNNLTTEQDHLKGDQLSFGVTLSGMSCTVK